MKKIENESNERNKVVPVWRGRPTLKAFYPFYLIACLAVVSATAVYLTCSLPLWSVGVLIPFVGGMVVLPLIFQKAWAFTVTDEEVTSGFHLVVGRSKNVPLDKVTDVVARQGIIGRLLDFGIVRIDTAGTPFPGVRFWGVEDPFVVEKTIRRVIRDAAEED